LRVVGYLCSSIGSKTDKSLELKIQREQIEKYCREHNFEIVNFYIDQPHESQNKRSALENIVIDAKKKQFERVVILKFDRLGYDKNVKTWLYQELSAQNVDIMSLTEQSVMKDPNKDVDQAKINLVLRRVRDIPSLPEVVTKVMELVSNPTSSAAELSKVIAHDPGLTTRVLRLVNSAYYGFPKQISSVQQAIMILGFTTMRGLVLSTSIFKIFTPRDSKSGKTIDYKKFWKHSIATALSARHIATAVGMTEAGDAFSCGILHDIGKVVFDQYDHSSYVEVFKSLRPYHTSAELLDMEDKIIGITHSEIGYRVADKWNLPIALSETIRCHHNPMEALSYTKLVCVVYLANNIVNILESPYPVISMNKFYPDVLEYLNIDEEKLYSLYNLCKDEIEKGGELDSFFE
jgi:putative nucleotidyltransferase with HDIG domain